MLKLSKLLGVVTIILLTTGCCMTDYSSTIRKVADPMLVELDSFYQTHKRHPNTKERDALLLKAGCQKVVGNVCFTGGDEILITRSYVKYDDYYVDLKIKNSTCFVRLNADGILKTVSCQQYGCIQWNH